MHILLQNIIQTGQEKNEMSLDMTPEDAGEYLFTAVRGAVYNWCLYDGQYDLEVAVEKFVTRLIFILTTVAYYHAF